MAESVSHLMHLGVITCTADATLGEVAVMLTQHHVHALVVADRDGRPLGIISDFDVLAGEWLSVDPVSLEAMRTMTAGELMSVPIDTVEADADVGEAAARMQKEQIHRLVVVDGGEPVGVISISDFVAGLAGRVSVERETVGDVMSDAMLVCRDKTPVATAARAMTQAGWRSVLVVGAEGRPLGVASGMDLINFCENDNCGDATVADVMHDPLTIEMSASLRDAADKMIKHHHHRLVVLDPDDPEAVPLGIVSSYDIVAEMARPESPWRQ